MRNEAAGEGAVSRAPVWKRAAPDHILTGRGDGSVFHRSSRFGDRGQENRHRESVSRDVRGKPTPGVGFHPCPQDGPTCGKQTRPPWCPYENRRSEGRSTTGRCGSRPRRTWSRSCRNSDSASASNPAPAPGRTSMTRPTEKPARRSSATPASSGRQRHHPESPAARAASATERRRSRSAARWPGPDFVSLARPESRPARSALEEGRDDARDGQRAENLARAEDGRAQLDGEHRRLSRRDRSGAALRPLLHRPDHRRRPHSAGEGPRHRRRRRRPRRHRRGARASARSCARSTRGRK